MGPTAGPSPREQRLGELLESYDRLGSAAEVESLRGEAGDLFPELVRLAGCLDVVRASIDPAGAEGLPESVGPYSILEQRGRGASGVVYRATDPRGAVVALKVMHPALGLNPEAVARFRREVAAAARVEHPGIVRILDHGEAEGRLYLALEFVDGVSLADLFAGTASEPAAAMLARLAERGVAPAPGATPDEALGRTGARLFSEAARALSAAHAAGLVHRDLKPENLLLGRDGHLKIIDLGLAKLLDEDFTSTLAVLGTPGFMSPEQAAGESRSVDARTDIYGLGASLYRVLTGRYPVHAESLREVLAAIVSERPEPISRLRPRYPRGLSGVVARCLEKERSDRYPDAATLAEDLERIAAGKSPLRARVPIPRRVRRFVRTHARAVGAGAAALVVVAAFLAWWWSAPAYLEVSTTPGATVVLNGRALATGEYRGEIGKGAHHLAAEREGFLPERRSFDVEPRQRATFVLYLRPRDPFDRSALAAMAEALGREAAMPAADPPRPRGSGDAPVGDRLALREPGALAEELGAYPEPLRAEPSIRAMAAARLLRRGLHAEAFAAARALADDFPDRKEPYRLALAALTARKLEETALFRELYARYSDARD